MCIRDSYQGDEYAHHSDGFVDTDKLLEKAKEIEAQVLTQRKEEFEPPKEGEETPQEPKVFDDDKNGHNSDHNVEEKKKTEADSEKKS